jgi:hypothetical protein
MLKIFKLSDFAILILFVLLGVLVISPSKDSRKIDKNDVPFFVIQQGKLSKNQIADLNKFSDAKNIWVINDNKDFNRATELIKQSSDAISYANQIGRLDLVSILLGIIAIIFGFVGIIGFLHIETLVKTQLNQAIKKEFEEGGSGRAMLNQAIKKEFEEGGRGQEIIREETRKYISKIEVDRDNDRKYRNSELAEDDEKYYEELFARTMKEFKN